jgi:L-threonylcarbamoyladenylate synthase
LKTLCLPADEGSIAQAAKLLQAGDIVGFPTETVYGLGANALDDTAVRKIFAAKERPADNPLIVHIAELSEMEPLCRINQAALRLAAAFWPGPLTMILPKKDVIPPAVSAGLETVAIRMPSHPVARALIKACGLPIAAPSGNRSGRPSPTLASHMMEDMDGRIPLILDGGACSVGVESTVVTLVGDVATVLRPGGITPDMIAAVLGEVQVADSVMRPLREGEAAPSPGMKHKHYAPRAQMTLYEGEAAHVAARICREYDALADQSHALILAAEGHLSLYGDRRTGNLGPDEASAAHRVFALLRQADDEGITRVFSETYPETGVGLAVMNRIVRAAGFDIVKCD